MKRSMKRLQDRVDDHILLSIKDGNGSQEELSEQIDDLVIDDFTIGELKRAYCGGEASAAKQRLRLRGEIEIGQDGIAKVLSEITPEDEEVIVVRRLTNAHGNLKNIILWAHQHGMHEECRRTLSALREMSADTAEAVEKDLRTRKTSRRMVTA